MIEVLASLASIVILCAAMVMQPTRGQCPKGWYLDEGIRRTGEYLCRRTPIGGDDDVFTGKETAYRPPGTLRSKIYCTNGTVPLVVNERTVACRRAPSW